MWMNRPRRAPLITTMLFALALSWCVENNNQSVCACLESGDDIEDIREKNWCGVSFYKDYFIGKETAYWGEIFSQDKLTMAHKTLPYNTVVRLTATFIDEKGQIITNSTIVRVNDKWPFIVWRSFDLTKRAFRELTEWVHVVKKGDKLINWKDLNLGVLNNVCCEIISMPEPKENNW